MDQKNLIFRCDSIELYKIFKVLNESSGKSYFYRSNTSGFNPEKDKRMCIDPFYLIDCIDFDDELSHFGGGDCGKTVLRVDFSNGFSLLISKKIKWHTYC